MRFGTLGLLFVTASCASQTASPATSETTPAPVATTPTEASATPATPAASTSSVAPGLRDTPFGGTRYGFVEATSMNGRYVALRRFEGTSEPRFGHHGSVMGGTTLHLVDLTDGSERLIDEVIDVEPTRTFFLLLEGSAPVLLDTRTGRFETLSGADARSDENACLAPRQASFSPLGKRVGWVMGGGASLRVRDLDSGEEWTVPTTGVVWRGFPDDEGRGAVLIELARGSTSWPIQQTSCDCRWCMRFAASFGFYGWGGTAFALVHVDGAGARGDADMDEDTEREWFAADAAGCSITPRDEDEGYEQGPWRRTCP